MNEIIAYHLFSHRKYFNRCKAHSGFFVFIFSAALFIYRLLRCRLMMFWHKRALWLLSNELNASARKPIFLTSHGNMSQHNMHTIMCNNLPKNTHFNRALPLFVTGLFTFDCGVWIYISVFTAPTSPLSAVCFPTRRAVDLSVW